MNGAEQTIRGQTIDKTMVKPGGVVKNYEVEMEHCVTRGCHVFYCTLINIFLSKRKTSGKSGEKKSKTDDTFLSGKISL